MNVAELSTASTPQGLHGETAPLLEADNLTFHYPGGEPIIRDWCASFWAGTTTAIIGPSGRGKSTLLYILGLMLKPTGGDLYLDGLNLANLTDVELSRHRAQSYGFVFQDAALDASRSVEENITESCLYRGENRKDYFIQAAELMHRFGVELPPTRKPGQVSGGQAQRIALCRALISSPRVLIADEPTGNLDPVSTTLVMDALHKEAQRGAAVILVTHSPELADSCNEIICL